LAPACLPACLRFLQVTLGWLRKHSDFRNGWRMRPLTGWWGGNALYFYEHKHKQPTKQEQEQEQDELEDKPEHASVSRQQLRTALAPFLKPTMREGAGAHKMDDSACSKQNG
jgi:hypothetical protein